MRALTLTQPWAGLVAAGIKLIENRPRKIISSAHFGSRIAIHASREIDREAYDDIYRIDPRTDIRMVSADAPWPRLSHITNAVIAVATVVRVVEDPRELGEHARWYFGPIGYVLSDVRALVAPVPCRGRIGLWTMPAAVELAVCAQIGDAP